MYTDEQLSDRYYENCLFSYNKNKEIEKITIEGKNENILSNLMPDAQDSFREFAAEIINRTIHVSNKRKSLQIKHIFQQLNHASSKTYQININLF